jgi:broad specificity phosphatase PhoE
VQDMEDPLTEKGIQQGERLAARFADIPFTTLVSSDMHRARTTAEIIAKTTRHEVLTSDLFREFQYPTSLVGLPFGDPKVEIYRLAHEENFNDLDWKFEDEQTLRELRARAKAALEFAKAQPKDVVVVSHGRFLRHMILMHLFDGGITGEQEQKANRLFLSSNTGITVLEQDSSSNWRLLSWNDHAHLG